MQRVTELSHAKTFQLLNILSFSRDHTIHPIFYEHCIFDAFQEQKSPQTIKKSIYRQNPLIWLMLGPRKI